MKNGILLICFVALLGFSSCMDTKYVTKKSTFDHVVSQVREDLAQQGFNLTGFNSETKNDLVVLGTSHTEAGGYGTELANNYVTRDTYSFTDASGNSMSYTVSYLQRETREGEPYVDVAAIAGCEVSNPEDYEKMCGSNSPIYQINTLEKDQRIKVVSSKKTLLLASGLTVGGLVLMLLSLK